MFKTFFISIILLFTGYAIGNTINIPADRPTIQAGIQLAQDGETVLVASGIYSENINFPGQEVRTLVNIPQTKNEYSVIWNGKDNIGNTVSSGIYHSRLKINKKSVSKKIILIR